MLAFIVSVAVCASSDGNKCGGSRKERHTGELSGLMPYQVSPVSYIYNIIFILLE